MDVNRRKLLKSIGTAGAATATGTSLIRTSSAERNVDVREFPEVKKTPRR
ncbi:twin-arginine translocation signal domain-containing protein [Halomarina oriensis]|uniref:Twin-arginine translocation signal domain-containing protein n=1 Tax=Halomarina oriensis TaxID=671145 RepID=A0A6B0GQH5_9EURY|nr:twin-arginine translocation signal domain-containing protein [Halomarina oriensis]